MEEKFYVTPLISNGAVLQRGESIHVWGVGRAGSSITGRLISEKQCDSAIQGDEAYAETDREGNWLLAFKALPAGGPYRLEVTCGKKCQSFEDIYIGDVWLMSGQSNMQLPMERVKYRYPKEYKEGSSDLIRQFIVPIQWQFEGPREQLTGGQWIKADPGHTPQFSAVGFFFARALMRRYQVPIGLILTAVGGTPVEAWLSREALKKFPKALSAAKECTREDYIKTIQDMDTARIASWHKKLSLIDSGIRENWLKNQSAGNWQHLDLGDEAKKSIVFEEPGAIWLRREVMIPKERANKAVRLSLGTVRDADQTYVNGTLVGSISYQYPPREYELAGLMAGHNEIVMRVIVERGHGHGGITVGKKQLIRWADGTVMDISHDWEYQRGAVMKDLEEQTFFERKPMGMYQGMIAPLHHYPVKGMCWYQGEMNADAPEAYPPYFENMIEDWRSKWQKKDLPVLFVQLPNYDLEDAGGWVAFRNMQRRLAEIEHTAMVVTIDCGEVNDLHPTQKETVGERLAMAAFQEAYGEKGNLESPLFEGCEHQAGKLILHFNHAEDGLKTTDGKELRGFTVCCEGEDKNIKDEKQAHQIEAAIESNKIVLSDHLEDGRKVSAVYYAWSNNPTQANLCSQKGLPASPFKCDIE